MRQPHSSVGENAQRRLFAHGVQEKLLSNHLTNNDYLFYPFDPFNPPKGLLQSTEPSAYYMVYE
jgi:hypothetical protein